MLYGDEITKYMDQLRANSAAFFNQAGQKPVEVYRIENFTPVEIPEDHQGSFYDGDSYVIVVRGQKSYDIHYWEGVDSTADETGSAAALSVELSEQLKMPSRHHLELMHEESDLFLSLWKRGIVYLHGGVGSGFKHVIPDTHELCLYQTKGKRYPRIFAVPLTGKSLNHGDAFVLDNGKDIYFWVGDQANEFEKVQALNFCISLKNNERKGKAMIHYPRDMGGETEATFWTLLGGKTDVAPAKPDEELKFDQNERLAYRLWHLNDSTGDVKVDQIKERPLLKSMLDSSDTYILEMYDKVYVWQGKHSSTNEKRAGMTLAAKYKAEWKKPVGTTVTRLPEGTEDAIWMSFFEGYYQNAKCDYGMDKGLDLSIQEHQDITKITNLHLSAAQLMLTQLGPNHTVTIYYLDGGLLNPVKLNANEHGIFFTEGTYIVDINSQEHRYMVCWMGPKLSGEDLAHTSTAMDKICNNELSSSMSRMRVSQCQEPEDFLQFFKTFVIVQGPRVPLQQLNENLATNGAMFRIQAPYGQGARAIQQIGLVASNLNSGDAFAIFANNLGYTWKGEGSNDQENQLAKSLLQFFDYKPASMVDLVEGQENDEFWTILQGKQNYTKVRDHGLVNSNFESVLYSVSNASGFMFMKQVPAFTQQCLLTEDVYILDCFNEIYIWVGTLSNKFEQRAAYSKSATYIEHLKDGRTKDKITVVEVKPTEEPPLFKVQFPVWDNNYSKKWIDTKPFITLKSQHKTVPINENPFQGFQDPKTFKISYSELKGQFPPGVKGDRKEDYLTDAEFETVFKMKKSEYDGLKDWKKQDLKKKVGLF